MTVTPKTLALGSLALLVPTTALGLAVGGERWAVGVLLTGLVMVANLLLWARGVRSMIDATVADRVAFGSAGFIVVKMVGLLLAVGGLLTLYPAGAVLLGSSVVVAAILFTGVAAGFLPPAHGEA